MNHSRTEVKTNSCAKIQRNYTDMRPASGKCFVLACKGGHLHYSGYNSRIRYEDPCYRKHTQQGTDGINKDVFDESIRLGHLETLIQFTKEM
jgi:hypothetical protein